MFVVIKEIIQANIKERATDPENIVLSGGFFNFREVCVTVLNEKRKRGKLLKNELENAMT
ncbi:MAG: hypothetical protein J6C33_09520 [Lachnospiraceae bacterium]|nr:hypothetical protein [Lachnospiraceae bacterium]